MKVNKYLVLFPLLSSPVFSSPLPLYLPAHVTLIYTPCCTCAAHVLSEWSHNFRPAYLRMPGLVKQLLQPRCTLALTATATPEVVNNLQEIVGFMSEDGAVETHVADASRSNLFMCSLAIGAWKDRVEMVTRILRRLSTHGAHGFFSETTVEASKSPVIPPTVLYVSTQAEADTLARSLASAFPTQGIAAYHAGLPSAVRSKTYTHFMSGRLCVCVATVAFGMGIDKPDIRAVVHMQAPKSIEEYVQQCGRAGRDGCPSVCIALLSENGDEASRSAAYNAAEVVDEHAIFCTLMAIHACAAGTRRICAAIHPVRQNNDIIITAVIPSHSIAAALNLRPEVVETLLYHLETRLSHEADGMQVLGQCSRNATIQISVCNPSWAIRGRLNTATGLPPVLQLLHIVCSIAQAGSDEINVYEAVLLRQNTHILSLGADNKGRPSLRCEVAALVEAARVIHEMPEAAFPCHGLEKKPEVTHLTAGISAVLRAFYELQASGHILLRFEPTSRGTEATITCGLDVAAFEPKAKAAATSLHAHLRHLGAIGVARAWGTYKSLYTAAVKRPMDDGSAALEARRGAERGGEDPIQWSTILHAAADTHTAITRATQRYLQHGTYASTTCASPHLPAEEMSDLMSDATLVIRRIAALLRDTVTPHTRALCSHLRTYGWHVYEHLSLCDAAIARVLCGMQTPLFPYREFNTGLLEYNPREPIWGKYARYDYEHVVTVVRAPLRLEMMAGIH